jgi:hypothetical protein
MQSAFEPRLSPVHSPERNRRAPGDQASDSGDDDDLTAEVDREEDGDGDDCDSDSGGGYSSAISDDDSIASPSSSVAPSPTKELTSLVSSELLHKSHASAATAAANADVVNMLALPAVKTEVFASERAESHDTPPTTHHASLTDGASDRIAQQIRHAIDSAAARVQEELGRREEFESELRAAFTFEPPTSDDTIRRTSLPLHEDAEFDDLVASLLHPGLSNGPAPVQTQDASPDDVNDDDLLLLMEVVIGEGRSETIEVHAGDRPDALAAAFASKHSLQPEAVSTLSRHIQDQLDALAEAEKEASVGLTTPGDTNGLSANSISTVTGYDDDNTAYGLSYSCSHPSDGYHFSIHDRDPHLEMSPPPAPTILDSSGEGQHSHQSHYMDGHELIESVDDNDMGEMRRSSASNVDGRARENQREYNYNCLMAKYGHYSQHSGKVDPSAAAAIPKSKPDALTMRNIELAERTRVVDSGRGAASVERDRPSKSSSPPLKGSSTATVTRAMPTMTTAAVGGKKKKKPAPAPVFQRLFALAESKDKWLQRAQRAKAAEEEREQEELLKHAATRSARYGVKDGSYGSASGATVEFGTNRTGGGSYSHAGERLYDEALADLAKKEKLREQRAVEREHQIDWMCPKCAFVNHHNDEWCKNMVSIPGPTSGSSISSGTSKSDAPTRRNSTSPSREPLTTKQQTSEAACGQPKPSHLFRPTLMTAPASVARAITRNKEKAAATSSKPMASNTSRRERSQRAMEEEFRRTCPFKPTINVVSEEIVREKLESEARAAGLTVSPVKSPKESQTAENADADTTELLRRRQRRDPHLALYEDAFHAKANREAREREYMAQFPFKPDIGVNALWVPADESREAFVERLAVSKYREFERRREVLVDKYAPRDRDPTTGRELFKPEVGRAPAFNRNERKLPVGDFLYEAHLEHREYLRRLQEQHELEIRQRQSRGFVSEASRQALEHRKKDTCGRIFDALLRLQSEGCSPVDGRGGGDGDVHSLGSYVTAVDDTREPHDDEIDAATRGESSFSQSGPSSSKTIDKEAPGGSSFENNSSDKPHDASSMLDQVVSPRRIDLSQLPAEIGRVVAIIFEFASYEELTLTVFAAHMDTLVGEVPGLTYTQVFFLADLLDDGKGSRRRYDPQSAAAIAQAQEDEELTFCPTIDKNSRAIVTKHGRADRAKVFLALNQYYEHYKKRHEQVEKQRRREFDKTHPFQPTLVTKRQERTRAAESFYERIAQLEEAQRGPPTPSGSALPTALSNARPSVRPIDSEDPLLIAAPRSNHQPDSGYRDFADTAGSTSHGTGEEDDAELTTRVLAALDEAHAAAADAGAASTSASLAKLSALVREGVALPSH